MFHATSVFRDIPILTVGLKLDDSDNRSAQSQRNIQWIDEVGKKLSRRGILLVDEVGDSGTTPEYCPRKLLGHNPTEIAVGVLHDKRKEKRGSYHPSVSRIFGGWEPEDRRISSTRAPARVPPA